MNAVVVHDEMIAMDAPTLVATIYEGKSSIEVVGDPIEAINTALVANERGAVTFESIKWMEKFFKDYGDPYGPPLVHRFCDGLYAREITMPAGMVIISKMHRKDNVAIISKGRVTVWSEQGRQDIEAPFTMITRPGAKRVLYIHEECVWTTVHATNEKDTCEVEKQLTVPEDDERMFRSYLIGSQS